MLEDKLIQYMDSDSEKFISILLLARQASLEPQGTVYILGQKDLNYSLSFIHLIPSYWAEIERTCTVHVALPKRHINQFDPVKQSRLQALRAYCPNIYTMPQGKFGTYAKFYQHFFVSNKEVIGCSKKLSNLLKNCLSPLVPHEPASVLRTHLSNQIQAKSLYISHKVNSRCDTS